MRTLRETVENAVITAQNDLDRVNIPSTQEPFNPNGTNLRGDGRNTPSQGAQSPPRQGLAVLPEVKRQIPVRSAVVHRVELPNILLSYYMPDDRDDRSPSHVGATIPHTALRQDRPISYAIRLVIRHGTSFVHVHLALVLCYIVLFPTQFVYSYV